MTDKIKLFEQKQIRTHWDAENEEWYFSVVDIVEALTESPNPRKYWSVLKTRLKKEGSEVTTNCSQLKMQAADGKFYKTDCMTTKNILRLVQSIPSPKAEPFKLWLAEVTTTAISRSRQPETFEESRGIAIEGGKVAGNARKDIERRTKTPVISPLNAKDKKALDVTDTDFQLLESGND